MESRIGLGSIGSEEAHKVAGETILPTTSGPCLEEQDKHSISDTTHVLHNQGNEYICW